MNDDRKVLIEEMTWEEIQEAIRNGKDTVLIIAGSIEQHGPHLPTGTDTVLGYEWGRAIALELGNALVAPVIRPGLSSHHLGFPGTITLPKATFQSIIKSYVRCLAAAGFRYIVIICSHGGNIPAVKEILPALKEEHSNRALVEAILDIEQKDQIINSWLEANGYSKEEAGIHAGLSETSCMLALRPESVRRNRLKPGFTGPVHGKELIQKGLRAFTKDGVLGDPSRASKEIGIEVNKMTVQFYCDAIRRTLGIK